jgi:hypothetical protein
MLEYCSFFEWKGQYYNVALEVALWSWFTRSKITSGRWSIQMQLPADLAIEASLSATLLLYLLTWITRDTNEFFRRSFV